MLKEKRCCYQQRFSCINGLPIQTLGRFSHLRPCTLSFLVPPKTSAHRPHRSVTSLFPLPARRFFLCVFVLSRLSFLPKLPLTAPIVPSLPYFHFPLAAFSSASLRSLISRFLPKLPLTVPIVRRHFLISTSRRLSRGAVSLFPHFPPPHPAARVIFSLFVIVLVDSRRFAFPPCVRRREEKRLREEAVGWWFVRRVGVRMIGEGGKPAGCVRCGGLVVCPAGRGEDDRGRGKARGVCQVRWVGGLSGG